MVARRWPIARACSQSTGRKSSQEIECISAIDELNGIKNSPNGTIGWLACSSLSTGVILTTRPLLGDGPSVVFGSNYHLVTVVKPHVLSSDLIDEGARPYVPQFPFTSGSSMKLSWPGA